MAKLKPKIKALDEVDEGLREAYLELNGEFILQIDGMMPGTVASAELAQFRDSNIQLKTANETLQSEKAAAEAKLADVDVDEYNRLKGQKEQLDGGSVVGMEQVKAMVKEATGPLEQKVGTLEAENAAKAEALQKASLDRALGSGARKLGVREAALDFVLNRAQADGWGLDGEAPVQKREGAPVFSKEKPSEPMSTDEYFLDLAAELDWAFEESTGGGGSGSGDNTPVGKVRVIPFGQTWTAQDIDDVAEGKAVGAAQ